MHHFSAKALKRRLAFIFAVMLGTFVLGLLLNAYYQAAAYNELLGRDAMIGAFIKTDVTVPEEVIRERLVNIEGVAEVQFVPKEQVLDRAISANPAIKEVMISGENPFAPYFVIRPARIASGFVQALVGQVQAVEGIEEVRYDANIVAVSEQLSRFRSLYRLAFAGVAAAGLLVAVFQFIRRWACRKLDAARYLALLAAGLAASIGGTALYYLFSNYAVPSVLVQMPERYLAYLLLAGVALTFVWEND